MKHLFQAVSMDLTCFECDKFMGTLNIRCEPEKMLETGSKLRKYLIDMCAFPCCDSCNATITHKIGKTIRSKDET